jgi:hypothetical protein
MIRRGLTVLLAVLLALSVIGWIGYMPPSALEMRKPVPVYAQIVYQNQRPVRSVLETLPVYRSLFPQPFDPDAFSKDWKNAALFFQTLENSPLTVASVPLGWRERRDTWVVVSALGSRAPGLRWRLAFSSPPGVKALRSYGAWPVWEYHDPAFPVWVRARFSIAEGLMICSISEDSHDLYYLLDTLDGRRPSAERKEVR